MPRVKQAEDHSEGQSVTERIPVRPYPLGANGGAIFPSDSVTRALKTSESVARDIVHDVVSGGLRTGDRLEPEALMLEQYGVSRESLREGLRLLEAQGLISIRRGPGGGPIVGRVDPANFGRMSTLFYHLVGATYEELFEAWVVTEATLAERAARNEDRALVREAMGPFVEAPDHDMASSSVAEFVAAHSQFHAVVASLAGNRVLQLMLQTIGQIVTHHVAVNADPRDAETDIDRDHVEVARAIAAGRPAKARSRMEEHIRLIGDFYKGQIGAEMHQFIEWR
jgi:GntR family transcriptional regulator, transcriptional repressor for pyruvate dehydrogenase complex